MTRKNQIIIGIIAGLVLLVLATLIILNLVFDREGVLEKIDEAIVSGDVDYLKSHLEIRGLDRDLTEKELENIGESLKEISVYSLKDQREDPEASIYIKKKGRERLIFNKYIIVLKPYKLTIAPNIEGTKVFIDGEEVGAFERREELIYRDLLPGYHLVELKYRGEYADLEAKEEVLALNKKADNKIYLNLEIPENYIYLSSNLENARLYIDGKDTGINIYKEYRLGPLDEKKEMKISARASIDGREYESEIVDLKNSRDKYYSLDIEYEEPRSKEEIRSEVGELIESYERGLIDAVNYGSYSYIDPYIEYGSPFMKAQKKLISNLYEKGTKENLLSYEIKNISILSQKIVIVRVRESHIIYYENGDRKQVNNSWDYTLARLDDKLYIRDIKRSK